MKDLAKEIPLSARQTTSPIVEVDRRLRDLETTLDLLQYKVDGWSVWPLFRFSVMLAWLNPTSSQASGQNWQLADRPRFIAGDLFKLWALPSSPFVVIGYASNRSDMAQGRYKDIFFDDLLPELPGYLKLEHMDNKIFWARSTAALIKSDLTTTLFKTPASILARLGGPGDIIETARALSAHLRRDFELELFTEQRVARTLLYFYWSKKLYTWLLRRIQPQYLLLVTAYADHAPVAAAKALGIEVIEFQHGLIDPQHAGYSWSPYALSYKATMPIPDRIFLYGKFWQQELLPNGFWAETQLCPVGSLRLDRYRKEVGTTSGESCHLVVTTQGIDTERLIEFLTEFLALVQGQLKVRLTFKLHPAETSKALYQAAFQANEAVQIFLSSESPSTFELLAQADFHLSIYSTCHYEALGLGVPTVVLPLRFHDLMLPLCQAGYAHLARTPQVLVDLIQQGQSVSVPDEIRALFFAGSALENMKRELGL